MNGFVCVDKEEGMTSFAAVSRLRKITGEKKAGHAGTLDPFATGVLPVAFGGGTRFLELFPSHDKRYTATVQLGIATDTLDITGEIVARGDWHGITRTDFEEAARLFTGDIQQLPPMYSSVKKDGVRLYTLARQGVQVQRQARSVRIDSITLLRCDEQQGEYIMDVRCGAGTYIRSLAEDIGRMLGCPAVLKALRRTAALGFTEEKCFTFSQLAQLAADGRLNEAVRPIDEALGFERLTVTEKQAIRFHNGGGLALDRLKKEICGRVSVYSPEGTFLGVGAAEADKLVPEKIYVSNGDSPV